MFHVCFYGSGPNFYLFHNYKKLTNFVISLEDRIINLINGLVHGIKSLVKTAAILFKTASFPKTVKALSKQSELGLNHQNTYNWNADCLLKTVRHQLTCQLLCEDQQKQFY
jgi:hypothetical protein